MGWSVDDHILLDPTTHVCHPLPERSCGKPATQLSVSSDAPFASMPQVMAPFRS
jgi:hypothetical protein